MSVVTIALPALRERAEDIPALVRFFIQRYARQLSVELPSIQPEALTYLQGQPWPGTMVPMTARSRSTRGLGREVSAFW